MPNVPGLDVDVYFGDPDKPLPNWRDEPEDESDDDEITPEQRKALTGMLGFDPAEIGEEDDDADDFRKDFAKYIG